MKLGTFIFFKKGGTSTCNNINIHSDHKFVTEANIRTAACYGEEHLSSFLRQIYISVSPVRRSPCIKILKKKQEFKERSRIMSHFSPRILFILKSVTIMSVIFPEINGNLCSSVMSVYDWRFWMSGIGTWVVGRVVPDVQKPSKQSSKKFLLGDDGFTILQIIGNHSHRRIPEVFPPKQNRSENFSFRILCSPRLFDILI